MFNYDKIEKRMRASRAKWVDNCGGNKKYLITENKTIILHVGPGCKHTFAFDDIQQVGYHFKENKNIFYIFMSKDSSTNRGKKTEGNFYNIFIYQDRWYECDEAMTLVAQFEQNDIKITRIPDRATLLDRIKNNKTYFLPTFHGWDLEDKKMELEEEEYIRLRHINSMGLIK